METAQAVGDGKVQNEELGGIYRRVMEIVRRTNEGKITYQYAMKGLQAIVEGKDAIEPCRRRHQSEFASFVRPSKKERRKSHAPYGSGLPESAVRLEWPTRNTEHLMAEFWEAENIPNSGKNYGRTTIQSILDMHGQKEGVLEQHDMQIVTSTIQWLGTSCGRDFLIRFIKHAGWSV